MVMKRLQIVWSALRPKLVPFFFWLFQNLRAVGMLRDSAIVRLNKRRRLQVFNLDLHVSVIADLKIAFLDLNARLVSWSISGSNRVFRKLLWVPDPVKIVDSKSWMTFDEKAIEAFNVHYDSFLKNFDGFISTYPPTFSRLYGERDKPIMTVVATRYEWPHSLKSPEWFALNDFVVSSSRDTKTLWVANNRGDQDYLSYYTGVRPRYVPSLCDYTKTTWDGESNKFLVVARSDELVSKITEVTGGRWVSSESVLGTRYKWSDLSQGKMFFVIPYNVSQMFLFELATMGVPVIVPSKSFIKKLRASNQGVLSELSFHEMVGGDISGLDPGDPNNYKSNHYLDWWLNRADYYDPSLMPNVAVVDSFEELVDTEDIASRFNHKDYESRIQTRNQDIHARRKELLEEFSHLMSE